MSYIPKVGEDCLVKLYVMHEPEKVDIKYVSNKHVIFILDGVERCEYIKTVSLSPLKTPAEIEREKDITQMFEDAEVQGSNGAFVRLYDKGYRKQQVKPLSRSYATLALQITNMAYDDLAGLGFIVQGGE